MARNRIRLSLFFLIPATSAFAQESIDHNVIARIREEGFQRSQVMESHRPSIEAVVAEVQEHVAH